MADEDCSVEDVKEAVSTEDAMADEGYSVEDAKEAVSTEEDCLADEGYSAAGVKAGCSAVWLKEAAEVPAAADAATVNLNFHLGRCSNNGSGKLFQQFAGSNFGIPRPPCGSKCSRRFDSDTQYGFFLR